MKTSALFVDLPNFYSHLLKCGIGDPQFLRDYFLCWLDFDRLAQRLTGDFSPVWVFHSGRRLGPSTARIDGKYLSEYVDRINTLRGVSAYDVDIEGKQREYASYECEECGHEGVAQWESEKGIDASLTVHLFDTVDTWDVAYLLSADADFVPVVRSLRRQGKVVRGAGFAERASALVRECYDYLDLFEMFVKDDVAAYEIFKEGGIAATWLASEVSPPLGVVDESRDVRLVLSWREHGGGLRAEFDSLASVDGVRKAEPDCFVHLGARGPIDLSSRDALIRKFEAGFPGCVSKMDIAEGMVEFVITSHAWSGVQRRLEGFAASVGGEWDFAGQRDHDRLEIEYEYDASTERYMVVSRDAS